MATPLGDCFTIKDVATFRVDGLTTMTGGGVGRREDVEIQLLLEGDDEQVAWLAV